MTTSASVSSAALPDLVVRYKVCFELHPELGPTDAGVRPIGLQVELSGTHDHDPGAPLPACEECGHVAEALQALARDVADTRGGAADGCTLSVSGPGMAHRFAARRQNRPELTATIVVLHEGHAQEPLDDREVLARDGIVERLRALGVREGSWSE